MQMVPRIKLGTQLIPVCNNRRKVNGIVKRPIVQNPAIYLQPRLLPPRIPILASSKGGDRRANGPHIRLLAGRDYLRVGIYKALGELPLREVVRGRSPNVVGAFEYEDVLCAVLLQGVAVVALEERGAEAAAENGVSASGLVVYGDVRLF